MRFIDEISKRLPLKITTAEWNDPVLTLGGDGWGLSVLTCWRISKLGVMRASSDEDMGCDPSAVLLGKRVEVMSSQSKANEADPCLFLEDGHVLEIFSVRQMEPWVGIIDGLGIFPGPQESR